jgi:GAF domain-containing protein
MQLRTGFHDFRGPQALNDRLWKARATAVTVDLPALSRGWSGQDTIDFARSGGGMIRGRRREETKLKDYQQLLTAVRDLSSRAANSQELMTEIVQLLRRERPYYNWVGFYLMEGPDELVLGPYAGKPTPHVRIPLHQGICGAAASTGQTLIVDDVSADPRYLACSLETQSEIVVPIKRDGRIVGEIDIDSDGISAFGEGDRRLLEAIAELVAPQIND